LQYETREMGVTEVRPDQTFEFAAPVLGFEQYRRFAILPDESAPPFHWLQSLEEKALAFPVVSAEHLEVSFQGDTDCLRVLGASSWDDVRCWIVVVVPGGGGQMRVNLRAPIVVNAANGLAGQLILREDYPVSCAVDVCRSLEARS